MKRTVSPSALVAAGLALPLLIIGALLGVVVSADSGLQRIPVALVNNDELITETTDEGEEGIIFASKPLVTELVTSDATDVDWLVTDTREASRLLASGEVYAVLEIPEDFSAIVADLGTTTPSQASFTIRTDPSHSYLAGVLADQVGEAIAASVSAEFGRDVTSGLFRVIVDLGDAISEAAGAADEVSDGTRELAEGVSDLAEGTAELRTGTRELADGYREFDDGLGEYLDGVDSLASGLEDFERSTRELPELADGIETYTEGVAALLASLSGVLPADTITELTEGGRELADQSDTAIDGVREGLIEVADGAAALADAGDDLASGSADIRTGTDELADGVATLDDGVIELDEGVAELAAGMDEFASDLRDGAVELEEQGLDEPSESTLDALVNPVAYQPDQRGNDVGLAPTLASVLLPIGLWAVVALSFLLIPQPPRSALTSSAKNSTLIAHTAGALGVVLIAQLAVGLTLMVTMAGVSWQQLGAVVPISVLGLLAFATIHYGLWWRSPRLLAPVSIGLLVIQVVTLGVVIPEEILPGPYRALSGLTPLAWFADGLLAAVASGQTGRIVGSAVALTLLSVAAVAWSLTAVRARRREESLRALSLESSQRL